MDAQKWVVCVRFRNFCSPKVAADKMVQETEWLEEMTKSIMLTLALMYMDVDKYKNQ
jgi:hypothetical protein